MKTYDKKLHDRLRHRTGLYCYNDHIGVDSDDIDALLDEIERLQEANRWIPVSERLPEHPNWVIVNDEAGNVFPAVYKKDEGWTDDLLDTYNEEYPKIISWRPLPQPPEVTQ